MFVAPLCEQLVVARREEIAREQEICYHTLIMPVVSMIRDDLPTYSRLEEIVSASTHLNDAEKMGKKPILGIHAILEQLELRAIHE